MTLQYTFGILLLVYSVTVALPLERKALKRGRSNHYEGDFGLPSDENSEENVPVKFGRTIYQSAWSIEDTESSEENIQNDKSIKKNGRNEKGENVGKKGEKRWSLSNLLLSALNFVNKLNEESAYPLIGKNKNFPKSTKKDINEDRYLQLFKKWLKKNKILKNDDSVSSYLSEPNSHFNDHNRKSYRTKPRRNSFKKSRPSRNKHKTFNEKRKRIKNSKSQINNKNDQPQTLKRNYHDTSAAKVFDQDSKELSTLYKTNHHDTFSDEDCESLEHKDSNILTNTKNNNKRPEGKEIDFARLKDDDSRGNTNTETARSSSSESDGQGKNNNEVSKKHQSGKSTGKINPQKQKMTSQVSDSSNFSPKKRNTTSYPKIHRKTSQIAITLVNFKALPIESGLNRAEPNNPNQKIIKTTEQNKGKNTLQSQNISISSSNNHPVISPLTEKSIEPISKDNQTKKLKMLEATKDTDNLNQDASNQSSISNNTTRSDSESFSSTQSLALSLRHEKNRKNSEIAGNASQVNIPLSSSSLQSQNKNTLRESTNHSRFIENVPPLIIPESSSASEPQGEGTPKGNVNNSKVNEKVHPINSFAPQTGAESIPKVIPNSYPEAKSVSLATVSLRNSPSQNQEEISLKKSSNYSQVTQNLPQVTIPVKSSSPKTSGESIPKGRLSNSRDIENVPRVTRPLRLSKSKSQDIRASNGNSEDLQMTKKISQAAMLVSSSSSQITDESIPKENSDNSLVTKSISKATKSSKDSSSQFQRKNARESTNSSQVTETFSPVNDSSPKNARKNIPKEKKSDSRDIESFPTATMPKSVSVSESHNIRTPTENTKDSQMTEIISQTAVPVIISSLKTTNENIPKQIQNYSQGIESVPQEAIPIRVSSSKPQGIRTLTENSKDSKKAEKLQQPVIHKSSSSPEAVNETITKVTSNDLPVLKKNVSQATESSKNSPRATFPISTSFKSQSTRTLKKILPQTSDESIINKTSGDFPEAKSVSQATGTLRDSSPQEKNTLKERSNSLQMSDSITTGPFYVPELQPQTESILKENAKNPAINEHLSSSVVPSSQSNEKHILEEKFKPKYISTKPDETSLKNGVNQKSTKIENAERKRETEPNNLFTKQKYSGKKFNGNHSPEKLTFNQPISTLLKNKNSDTNSQFEEAEIDSYSASDETHQQNSKNIKMINQSARENIYTPSALDIGSSTKHQGGLKRKSELSKNLSFTSSSNEEFNNGENDDQINENEPEQFNTFLQYIYKNSNNSYFQSFRNEKNQFLKSSTSLSDL